MSEDLIRHFIRICTVWSSEKEVRYCSGIINCDPSIYIMDFPDLTISIFIDTSTGLQRVKIYSRRNRTNFETRAILHIIYSFTISLGALLERI